MHDLVNFLLGNGFEIPALGEVLANETIGIFVRTALPRCVWMSKVKLSVEFVGDPFVVRKFFAVVGCDSRDYG